VLYLIALYLGSLNIDQGFTCVATDRVISLTSKARTLSFFATTNDEAAEWCEAIKNFYQESPRAHPQRFQSSYPPRSNTTVQFYTCGRDYFTAVAVALLNAKLEIFIAGWMLSPGLLLTRPPAAPIRLDQVLKFKAEQGVKVYVLLFKEIEYILENASLKCQVFLESLHPNIKVIRHPNKLVGGSIALFWSHHEKIVVVDR
jgi:phospholipase D1/2